MTDVIALHDKIIQEKFTSAGKKKRKLESV